MLELKKLKGLDKLLNSQMKLVKGGEKPVKPFCLITCMLMSHGPLKPDPDDNDEL